MAPPFADLPALTGHKSLISTQGRPSKQNGASTGADECLQRRKQGDLRGGRRRCGGTWAPALGLTPQGRGGAGRLRMTLPKIA